MRLLMLVVLLLLIVWLLVLNRYTGKEIVLLVQRMSRQQGLDIGITIVVVVTVVVDIAVIKFPVVTIVIAVIAVAKPITPIVFMFMSIIFLFSTRVSVHQATRTLRSSCGCCDSCCWTIIAPSALYRYSVSTHSSLRLFSLFLSTFIIGVAIVVDVAA